MAFRTVSHADWLTTFANWVYGKNHKQWALLLSFSTTDAVPAGFWSVGSTASTGLAYYPRAVGERAIPVGDTVQPTMKGQVQADVESVDDLVRRVSQSMALSPWQSRFPFLIRAQAVVLDSQGLMLVDDHGHALPLLASSDEQLLLSSVCGGRSTLLAGEWTGETCRLHAASDQ